MPRHERAVFRPNSERKFQGGVRVDLAGLSLAADAANFSDAAGQRGQGLSPKTQLCDRSLLPLGFGVVPQSLSSVSLR
jgi:hypothetical protein